MPELTNIEPRRFDVTQDRADPTNGHALGVFNEKTESPHERFSRLANVRVNRIVKDCRLLGNLCGATYDFTDAEERRIRGALQEAINGATARLRMRLAKDL